MKLSNAFIASAFALAQVFHVFAHGDPETAAAVERRGALITETSNILARNCASRIKSRDEIARRNLRKDEFVNRYLTSRGLEANFETKRESAATCVLAPEQELGPYYLAGELVREDIQEGQPGLDLLLDVQVIDVNTCAPLENVMIDFWSCNSTGKYSGFAAENTLGLTYLRGLQASDSDGIVQVLTTFPGWYGGRAQHIHIRAHVDYTVSNNHISGGKIVHTGQLFFDQAVLSQVNVLSPYTLDKNAFTLNSADRVVTQQANNTAGYDAFVDIALTGSTLSEGVVGTITIALNPNA